jgi:hypothetical protein
MRDKLIAELIGGVIKESDGSPWPYTVIEAEHIADWAMDKIRDAIKEAITMYEATWGQK